MSRYSNYNRDPREIKARFNSKCAETGKQINEGDTCIYYPSSKQVFHPDSKQAEDFRNWQMDINCMGGDY